jgi:hypothetical protein
VDLAFALDHPKFYALLIGLLHLYRKVFQRSRRLGCAFFGVEGCGLQALRWATGRVGGGLASARSTRRNSLAGAL